MVKKKKKRVQGRPKGNKFENIVAKLIVSAFAQHGITGKDCYRTPSSGGHRFAKKQDPGDLVLSPKMEELFPFEVEAKFYKEINLWPLWAGQKKWGKSWDFKKWLEQVCRECPRHRHPLLVFKQNFSFPLCALPEVLPVTAHIGKKMNFVYNGKKWYVCKFSDMLYHQANIGKE